MRDAKEAVALYAAEFEGLQLDDAERIARFKQYREEAEKSRRPDDIYGDTRAQDRDYGRKRKQDHKPRRHNIRIPLDRALTVKHSYRVFGRLPDVAVDRRGETDFERHRANTIEKLVWGITRCSNGEMQDADGAWDGSEIGAAAFEVYWNDATAQARYRNIDPAGCFVVRGLDDPHDFQRFYRCWEVPLRTAQAEYRDQEFQGLPIPFGQFKGTTKDGAGNDIVTIVQVSTKTETWRFELGGQVPLAYERHDLGFVPYVVIPNIGPERCIWGWADYEFYRDLTDYIPALFSREADIIKQVSGGGYIAEGMGSSNDTIKRVIREGGVVSGKQGGKVTPIEAASVPSFEPSHRDAALEMLKWVGFAPDAAWGLSGATSGSDRQLQLQPMLELSAHKQTHWSAGKTRLFRCALRMVEKKTAGRSVYTGTVRSGGSRRSAAFTLEIGPDLTTPQPQGPPTLDGQRPEPMPLDPKKLFDGDYDVRFVYANRIDPDDPAFVMSEIGKFTQGAQSLETTLERLGHPAPEDEMVRIEKEAERFPWIRDGVIKMVTAQLNGQDGTELGPGRPTDTGAQIADASQAMSGGNGRANDQDAAARVAGAPGTFYGAG
jgi:hypothetical protein